MSKLLIWLLPLTLLLTLPAAAADGSLNADERPIVPLLPIGDAEEPDEFYLPTPYSGVSFRTFEPDGDIDYFAWTMQPLVPTTFRTTALTGGADTELFVYHLDGTLIDRDDDTGENGASELTLTAVSTQDVIIVVTNNSEACGADVSYQFEIITDDSAVVADATTDAQDEPDEGGAVVLQIDAWVDRDSDGRFLPAEGISDLLILIAPPDQSWLLADYTVDGHLMLSADDLPAEVSELVVYVPYLHHSVVVKPDEDEPFTHVQLLIPPAELPVVMP